MEKQKYLVGDAVWWIRSVTDAVEQAARTGTIDINDHLQECVIWCCELSDDGLLYKVYYIETEPHRTKMALWGRQSDFYASKVDAAEDLKTKVIAALACRESELLDRIEKLRSASKECQVSSYQRKAKKGK